MRKLPIKHRSGIGELGALEIGPRLIVEAVEQTG
jgi:hypothetical protein